MKKETGNIIGKLEEALEKDTSFITHNSLKIDEEEDNVNHPSHYTWLKDSVGIEVIDITRHLDFDRGNAIKYILRCGMKEQGDIEKAIEDIEKAIWYLNDYKENFLVPIKQSAEELE